MRIHRSASLYTILILTAGADVIHPAPGAEGRPSFASLVSSVDINTAKYIAKSSVQTGRQEIIDELEDMCIVCRLIVHWSSELTMRLALSFLVRLEQIYWLQISI